MGRLEFRGCGNAVPGEFVLMQPLAFEIIREHVSANSKIPVQRPDSFRFNHDQGGTPSRPESRQPNPKTPVGTIEQESFGIWSWL